MVLCAKQRGYRKWLAKKNVKKQPQFLDWGSNSFLPSKNPPAVKPFNKPLGKPRGRPRRVNVISFYQKATVLDKLTDIFQNFKKVLV